MADGANNESTAGAGDNPAENSNLDLVMQNPFLSEFVLKVGDKIDHVQMKIRDSRAGIETEKSLRRPKSKSASSLGDPETTFNLSDANTAEQEAKLHKVADEFTQTMLNFDALVEAVQSEQYSSVVSRALEEKSDSILQLDKEEVDYMKGLISEQKEVSSQVVALENERLQAHLEQMEAMVELEKEMSFLGELYPGIVATKDDGDDAPAKKKGKKQTAKEIAFYKTLQGKKEMLAEEEKKLNQMRFMLQKLIAAASPQNMGDEMRTKCLAMSNKCGQPLKKLQQPGGMAETE